MTGITARYAEHAARQGTRAAVILDDASVTWNDLLTHVAAIARWIDAALPPRGALALHLPNCPALVLLFLAAARAGREAHILDADWPHVTARDVISALTPARIVSADPHLAQAVAGIPADIIDARLDFAAVAQKFSAPATAALPPEPDDRAAFYVGFTSGSTGLPKAYRRDHASWRASFDADAVEFAIDAGDVVLAPGNLSHSLYVYALAHGLHAGASVILCRRFRPAQVLELARAHRASILYGVPTQLALLCEAAEKIAPPPLSAMRWVLSTGAKWFASATPALRALFPATRFAEFYGASETSFITVAKDGEDVPPNSVGRAFHGVHLSIHDENGAALPPLMPGAVYIDSPMLFSGYALGGAQQPPRIGNAMTVGDIGYLDAHGYLHLVGRARRMIVTSGKNLFPEEVEAALEHHPAIACAAVFAVADAKRGERLIAAVRVRDGAKVRRAALMQHLRAALPLFKVPRIIVRLEDWPLTRSGKTDFAAVAAQWEAGCCTPLE